MINAGTAEIDLPDETATVALAHRLAPLLRPGDIIALSGDLGAGKTALVRALIRFLGDDAAEVPSPTFTLVQTYTLPSFELWHFDLFRIETPRDAIELDIEEAFATGVSLIEWPDRLGAYLPAARLDITIDFAASGRCAAVTGHGEWAERMAPLCDD